MTLYDDLRKKSSEELFTDLLGTDSDAPENQAIKDILLERPWCPKWVFRQFDPTDREEKEAELQFYWQDGYLKDCRQQLMEVCKKFEIRSITFYHEGSLTFTE